MKRRKLLIDTPQGRLRCIMLSPRDQSTSLPGILWIHGGGYIGGTAAMVHVTKGKLLAKKYGAVVIAPAYRKARRHPFPAAFEDCCAALRYMHDNSEALGINPEKLIVGGESAGGGLAAAVCLYARDKARIPVLYQIPLYPMLDCRDTESSRDNHARNWNTRKNHHAWKLYLRDLYTSPDVPKYASPSRESDYSGLPPCYTYVEDGEPFYDETLTYVRNLNEAGVSAKADVFHGHTHAFDMFFWTRNAREARRRILEAAEPYFR